MKLTKVKITIIYKFFLNYIIYMREDIKYTCPANNSHYMVPGPQGDQGPRGIAGKDGRDGKNGRDGINGLNGRDGNDGAEGKQGEQGPRGQEGEPGKNGLVGPQGPQGPTWTQVKISTYTYAQLAGIGNTPSNGGTDGIYNGVHPNPSATSGTDRKFSWNKEDFLFKRQQFSNLVDDHAEDKFLGYNFNMKEVVNGGYITLYPINNESYNFTNLYISMNYRSAKFLLSASNDKYNWTDLIDTNTSLGVKITSNSNDYYTAVDADATNSTYKFTFTNTDYYHYWRFKLIGNPVNNLAESTPIFRKLTSLNKSFNMLSNYSGDLNAISVPTDAFFVKLEGGPITIKYLNGTASTTRIRVIRIDCPDEQINTYDHKSDENIAIIGPPENTTYNIVEEFTLTDDQVYYFIVYHGDGYNAEFSVSRGMSQFRINDFRFS